MGTMRFADKNLDKGQVLNLFELGIEQGINTHHVSSEYNSHQLVCDVYNSLDKSIRSQFNVICKLANPHFDAETFEPSKLRKSVETYLSELGFERLSVVQWMWRLNPLDDQIRCNGLKEQAAMIKASFDDLIKEGKVGAVACFPYSSRFMNTVRELGIMDGQVNYMGLLESDAEDAGIGAYTIALRPFKAGEFLSIEKIATDFQGRYSDICEDWNIAQYALAYPLLNNRVTSVVVSLHNKEQIAQAAEVGNVSSNDEAFSLFQSIAREAKESGL